MKNVTELKIWINPLYNLIK